MKRLTLHRLAEQNSAELSDTYVKATTTKFFGFVPENVEI
jgi:hypothetical protein